MCDPSFGNGEPLASNEVVSGRQVGLAGLAGFLDRFLLPLVLVCAGLGVVLPGPGRRLDAHGAILLTLAVLVFCTGSSVTFADLKGLRAAAGRMTLALAATTVILPVLAWLASRLVSERRCKGGSWRRVSPRSRWHPWRSPAWPAARSWWRPAC